VLAVSGEKHGRAKVSLPLQAQDAPAARDGGVDGDPCPREWAGLDHSRNLVTEDERALADLRVADLPISKPVQVGPA
jgi:hypothetical protein